MAEPTTGDEDAPVQPPTVEERETETVDDEVKPNGDSGPESKDGGPDVSARLDAIEKELAALKAMMDTLGYTDPTPADDGDDGVEAQHSIEDLFD
jgi:hypothetical protein